jgi:hypothetical protein
VDSGARIAQMRRAALRDPTSIAPPRKNSGGLGAVGRLAYGDGGDPGEEDDDGDQECGVVPRQEQEDDERTGREGKDSDRSPARITHLDSVANLACSDLSNAGGRTLSQVVAPSRPSLRWLGWQYLIPDRARLASTYQFSSSETGSL